jgi:hypothetical protein
MQTSKECVLNKLCFVEDSNRFVVHLMLLLISSISIVVVYLLLVSVSMIEAAKKTSGPYALSWFFLMYGYFCTVYFLILVVDASSAFKVANTVIFTCLFLLAGYSLLLTHFSDPGFVPKYTII